MHDCVGCFLRGGKLCRGGWWPTMQADVERTKDRDRARKAYATTVLMHDLTDPLAAGIALERVHLRSESSQVTIRECSA